MAVVYTTYEAKAKFGEIMQKVKAGQRVVISYRGEPVAEIKPLEKTGASLEASLRRLELEGVVGPPAERKGKLRVIHKKRGALARFL